MICADLFLQLDDQSFALQLQLEKIETQRELQFDKWVKNNSSNFALAFDDFEIDLKKTIVLIENLKFAHSIIKAIDFDVVIIEESKIEKT